MWAGALAWVARAVARAVPSDPSGEEGREFLDAVASVMVACAAVVVALLTSGLNAKYGRYSKGAEGLYAWKIHGRVAWITQEAPSLLVPLLCAFYPAVVDVVPGLAPLGPWLAPDAAKLAATPNRVLLAAFLVHYFNRTVVFPMRLRDPKATPVFVWLLAFLFCLVNGYLQGRFLTRFADFPDTWALHPQFLAGLLMFLAGFAINNHADYVLMNLRKPGETGYKIPRGGAFELVSGANFFGEILEWSGFAVAGASWPGAAFAIFTFANIGPRGAHHHASYKKMFGNEYPKHRRAVLPFVW